MSDDGRGAAPGVRRGSAPRIPEALHRRWRESLRAWGAPPATHDAALRLADPDTIVVVTGQQPGPWGGPLYSLYKAATAVALAEARAGGSGGAVAVFWVQGEDTDWGEVGWGALPRPDLGLFRHRFEPTVPSRHWVGSGAATSPEEAREIAAAWNRAPGRLGLPGSGPELLADGFIRVLLEYLGPRGLLPLDGRWPEIREAAAPLWRRYLPRHRELADAVSARGAARIRAGMTAPLGEDTVDHGLFVLDGERRGEIDPSRWEDEVGDLLAAGRSDRLAPSVLLRAVLQDHLLAPSAHVVGAGEAAYLDQLEPVYRGLEVTPPERFLRLCATVAPRGLLSEEARAAALEDPEAWVAGEARRLLSPRIPGEIASLRRMLEEGLERLGAESGGAKDVSEVLGSARKKLDHELGRVAEVLERRGRQELYRREPRLRHLGEFLRPRRGEQERGLSGGTLALLFGERAPEVLLAAARRHVAESASGPVRSMFLEADDD